MTAVVAIVFIGYYVFAHKSSISEPINQAPRTTTFQEPGGGCGNIFVYKVNDTDTAGISVSAWKDKLNLSNTEKTYEIGKTEGLEVEILTGKNIRYLYCNDVTLPGQPQPKKLIGKSGQAIITVSNTKKSELGDTYTATIKLKNVTFKDESGNNSDIIIDDLMFKDIVVGWLAG